MHVFIDFWKLETENNLLHVFSFLHKLNFENSFCFLFILSCQTSFLVLKIENYFWKQKIKGKNNYQTYSFSFPECKMCKVNAEIKSFQKKKKKKVYTKLYSGSFSFSFFFFSFLVNYLGVALIKLEKVFS